MIVGRSLLISSWLVHEFCEDKSDTCTGELLFYKKIVFDYVQQEIVFGVFHFRLWYWWDREHHQLNSGVTMLKIKWVMKTRTCIKFNSSS
jgi:hypothetical protein